MAARTRRQAPGVGMLHRAVLMLFGMALGMHASLAAGAGGGGEEPATSEHVHVGITRPLHMAHLAATSTSRAARIEVAEGQLVTEGDLLVVLDDGVQKVRADIAHENASTTLGIDQAAAKKAYAQAELERFERLGGDDSASLKELTDARFAARTAELEHKEAIFKHEQNQRDAEREGLLLERLYIRAPFEGYVVELPMHAGEVVEEGAVVAVIASVQWIEISVDCPLSLADRVHDGEAYRVSPIGDGGPGMQGVAAGTGEDDVEHAAPWPPRPATVVHASRIADPASQTFRVKLLADNRDLRWMAGIKVGVDFGAPLSAEAIQALGMTGP